MAAVAGAATPLPSCAGAPPSPLPPPADDPRRRWEAYDCTSVENIAIRPPIVCAHGFIALHLAAGGLLARPGDDQGLSHDTRTVWSQQSWLLTTYADARLAAVDVVCFVAMGAGIGNDTLSREEVVVFDHREWLQRRRGHDALPRAVLPQHVDGGADVSDAHGPLELRARLVISTMGMTGFRKKRWSPTPHSASG
jgi:hypothetical protein